MKRKVLILLSSLLLLLAVVVGLWCLPSGFMRMNVKSLMSDPGPQLAKLRSQQRAYLTSEGPNHRGKEFEHLGIALMMLRAKLPALSLDETIGVLGQPDLEVLTAEDATYIYSYDRFGSRDWCFIVFVKNRQVTEMGVNAVGAIKLSAFRPYTDPLNAPKNDPGK